MKIANKKRRATGGPNTPLRLLSILISRISCVWLALVDAENAIGNVSKLFPIPLSSLSMIANVLPVPRDEINVARVTGHISATAIEEGLGVQRRIYYRYLRLQGCAYSSSPIGTTEPNSEPYL